MPVVSPATVERLMRSLDGHELAAFVRDLWAARGWETTVTDDIVVARDPGWNRHRVLRCVAADGPWPPAGEASGTDADTVVTSRDPGAVDGDRPSAGPRVLGPRELRRQLLYAVDRQAANRIFQAHFGRPLATEPRTADVRGWFGTAGPRELLLTALFVVLAVSLAIAVAGGPDGHVGGGPGPPGGTMATSVPVATPPSAGGYEPPPAGGGLFRYPPGLGPSGVTDVSALVAAHRSSMNDGSWDLLLIHRGSKDLLNPNRQWVRSRQTVDRRNASQYWYRVTGLERRGADSFQSVIYDDYGDGDANYRRVADGDEPAYQRTRLPDGGEAGLFVAASAAFLQRYLDTSESHVELVNVGSATGYRVIATGTPKRIFVPVTDYTAVALVGRRGLVYHLTVEFTRLDRKHAPEPTPTPPAVSGADVSRANPAGEVRFVFVFRDIGTATVLTPAWYEDAREATNGTNPPPWPNDPAV